MDPLVFKSLILRCAEEADAEYILGLRLDPLLNRFLSKTDGSLEQQKKWLRDYKLREAARTEYYFIIQSLNYEPWGTVRVYDICSGSFSWGSWIIPRGKPPSVAVETTLMIYDFAFGVLDCARAHFKVCRENTNVIRFHRRLGARSLLSDETEEYFELSRDEYQTARPALLRILDQV